ncbi:MAG: glycosyltransferase family 2 protein [Chitinophagaceae bacterium]|nr:glycosyltransferase family 2 protein [Chitinophagaceae bacterium]
MNGTPELISIIIVNYKSEKKTISFIKTELSKIKLPNRIVVVNNSANAESDRTLAKQLDAQLISNISSNNVDETKNCFVISEKENLGFARGNNLGADFVHKNFRSKYLIFSNNDLRFITESTVEMLVEKLENLPEKFAGIGPAVIGLDNKHQSPIIYLSFFKKWFLGLWVTPFLNERQKLWIYKIDRSNFREGQYYSLMGSFFMLKSDDFFACDKFDPNTFLYGEEVILSERLMRVNKYFYYYPNCKILHEHSQTITNYFSSIAKTKMQFDNDVYYFRTYRNLSRINQYFCWISVKLHFYLKQGKNKIK